MYSVTEQYFQRDEITATNLDVQSLLKITDCRH